ncbi:hypothetical protein MJ_1461 [Methanocaldococcus jannaschii DSM 2661]|uniref:Uncharacterized protein MJ1461 n=1 Tax=Methanocaldococcus jannaschii (strain ATCC 43067 / DSM 2661 / JAL-1 / JCM 10045 / NBRC 100440) TaxID=243232 RepID=Y1461_METJA|nr:hypothetical protein [Methanocaldococcus jannaschii]Q58856.1 RecName: Full=Uncharacterized protein MJ1461 [Methanocaldococcus jannaschii DSM 2661]AAB99475.1 hypothetical protein MJ_1461 [Methanocaldococcus jannaschii DSM 2661]
MEQFDFDSIFNNAVGNMKYFIKKVKKYEEIKKHEDILKKDLLNAVNVFIERFRNNPCICKNRNNHSSCTTNACGEIENRMKNWVEKLFEYSDDEEKLNEFFKIIAKDAMKFVELDFEPLYILCGLEEIRETAEEKLKEELPTEEYLKVMEEFDDLIERMSLVATAVYMEFEDRVFERMGINKNLKYNIIKLGLKKMNIN